jgi:hypothetical protein
LPSIAEIRWGRKLASEGKWHIAYVQAMGKKEYEFDYPPSDKDVFEAMLQDLAEHKKTCQGCGQSMLEEAKRKVRELRGK